jgi:hypothetical protein
MVARAESMAATDLGGWGHAALPRPPRSFAAMLSFRGEIPAAQDDRKGVVQFPIRDTPYIASAALTSAAMATWFFPFFFAKYRAVSAREIRSALVIPSRG